MRFLAFEGLDAAGKSTLIRGIEGDLRTRGVNCTVTREPGGTPLGSAIRALLLSQEEAPPVPRAEALLYQADRAQHVDTVIRPALAAGRWVLSDRFDASSRAFQAGGRAISERDMDDLCRLGTDGLRPDLYILLDLSVGDSVLRLRQRGQEMDRFEKEERAFHERVRAAYLELARREPRAWLVLDANRAPTDLIAAVITDLRTRKWLD